jgi:poly(3-hydroxybutyrate) depolymerase
MLAVLAATAAAATTACAQAGNASLTEQKLAGNPMHYLVSLPSAWTPDREWPVVVVITDAYREFETTAKAFADARGPRPFIIVVPLVLSGGASAQAHMTDFDYSAADWATAARDGNCKFDEDGMSAVLADVRTRYRGASRVFMTGWEAGGHVVLSQLFNHPERVAGIVAVTPNYQARCVVGAARATGESVMIPIRGFHGSNDRAWGSTDRPWLVDQWQRADSVARVRGFTNVKDTLIQGEGHGAMPAAVLEFFSRFIR